MKFPVPRIALIKSKTQTTGPELGQMTKLLRSVTGKYSELPNELTIEQCPLVGIVSSLEINSSQS